ncbi:unnamed protein product, partial [Owenia fusiformis]
IKILVYFQTYNFLRGIGYQGQGRGGTYVFNWNNFNFPLPSVTSLPQSGYTTENGVIVPYLSAFLKIADSDPRITNSGIIDEDQLKVIGCVVSTDGFSFKPGLVLDKRTKHVVGTTDSIDKDYTIVHENIDPIILKNKYITENNSTCLETIDGMLGLPISQNYHGRGHSAQETANETEETIYTLHQCASCIQEGVILQNVCIT